MFLSQLILNQRNRDVRRDLAAPYEFHRTVMREFPSFADGGGGRVLFRIDASDDRTPPTVLVQSEKRPDWSFLGGSDYAIVRPVKEIQLLAMEDGKTSEQTILVPTGRCFRFRLVANPTFKRDGKRHALLREDEQLKWLARKAAESGFELVPLSDAPRCELSEAAGRWNVSVTPIGTSRSSKRRDGNTLTISHNGVRFDGVLRVIDALKFIDSVNSGIGSAKGFGFGLLSIARC